MEQGWFYAEQEKSVGPVSIDTLVDALRRLRDPGEALVWHSGFEDWRAARDIPELAARVLTPRAVPVIRAPDPRSDRFTTDRFISSGSEPAFDDDLLTPGRAEGRWRRRLVAGVAALVAVALIAVFGMEYVSRMREGSAVRETQTAVAAASAPEPPKEAVASNRPDAFPKMIADAYQVAIATDALVQKLWSSIEPPALQEHVNYATVSRRELDAYRAGVATAEENAKAALDQYIALLKAERETLDDLAKSSGVAESARQRFLQGVDDRHTAALELNRKMLSARVEFYRALGSQQKVMIEQFGKYKVVANGQLRFSNDAALKQFDAALADVTAASRQLDLLEDDVMKLRDAEQQKWKDLEAGDGVATSER